MKLPHFLIRKRRVMTEAEFQHKAIDLLNKYFPDRSFDPGQISLEVRSKGTSLGLQNMYAIYCDPTFKEKDCTSLMKDHFERVIGGLKEGDTEKEVTWQEAIAKVRPQIMPYEYSQYGWVVEYPFISNAMISVVRDLDNTYVYVKNEEIEKWGVSKSELLDIAVENLDKVSHNIEMTYCEGPEKYMGIELKDGYDAARILIPKLRQFVFSKLGAPCYAIIPNRDFLFFWSIGNSKGFHKFAADKAEKDYSHQPYPLSPTVLTVATDSIEETGV